MIERIIILCLLLTILRIALKRLNFNKQNLSMQLPDNITLPNSDLPTVLFFWTEHCVQCRKSQKPSLQRLQRNRGKFNLVEINALEAKELTRSFNIKTVPSTVVISAKRKPVFINNGFKNEVELAEQLDRIQFTIDKSSRGLTNSPRRPKGAPDPLYSTDALIEHGISHLPTYPSRNIFFPP